MSNPDVLSDLKPTQEDWDKVIEDPTPYSEWDKLGRNPKIKRNGVTTHWTKEMQREYLLCAANLDYFAKKYVKIVNLDKGLMNIDPYPYQEKMWKDFANHRFNIVLAARQSGKCHLANTKMKLRNKKTGQIITLSAEEFHEFQKAQDKSNL